MTLILGKSPCILKQDHGKANESTSGRTMAGVMAKMKEFATPAADSGKPVSGSSSYAQLFSEWFTNTFCAM